MIFNMNKQEAHEVNYSSKVTCHELSWFNQFIKNVFVPGIKQGSKLPGCMN